MDRNFSRPNGSGQFHNPHKCLGNKPLHYIKTISLNYRDFTLSPIFEKFKLNCLRINSLLSCSNGTKTLNGSINAKRDKIYWYQK